MRNIKITLEDGTEVEAKVTDKVYKEHFEKEEEVWKPTDGDTYWYIETAGDVDGDIDVDLFIEANYRYSSDRFKSVTVDVGNCFRTEEEAKAHLEYLKALTKIKRSSSFEPDWEDYLQTKYHIAYNHGGEGLYITNYSTIQLPAIVFYETKEQAEQAIKDLEKEYKIIFGVK